MLPLPAVNVAAHRDGVCIAQGSLDYVMGHPANAVLWLARESEALGRQLRTGQFVFTGNPYEQFVTLAKHEQGRLDALVDGAFGDVFLQLYASTEAPGPISALPRRRHRAGTDAERRRLSSAGLPVPGVEVRIAGEQGEELANGEAGEIWVRHRGVISGYFDNPEQTAQEFAGGWWMSGDVGLLDHDGFLYLIDRKKDMIVTGGLNVYAAEVEAALHAHPGVLLAAVVGIPSAEWGEAVHAEVILRDGAVATDVELMQHIKDAIGAIKAPKSITLVGGLPMSAVGKVLRRKVQDKYWQGKERRIG